MKDSHRSADCPARNVKHCYLCGSTEHQKSDCEKFVPLRRARGRRNSGEIEDLPDDEATPISEDEETPTDIASTPTIPTEPEDPPPTEPPHTEEPTTDNYNKTASPITTPNIQAKPTTSKSSTKTPMDYAPFTRRSTTKRPTPATPEKNTSRKKLAGEST